MDNKIWFTSDLHLAHENIILYANRPFKDVTEMDNILISNINKNVMENDFLYILGDFSLYKNKEKKYVESCFNRIHCNNKILIKGNHDHKDTLKFNWTAIYDYHELDLENNLKICLCHYPISEWNQGQKGAICLHGHQHNKIASLSKYKIFDIGVDAWNFNPVSLEQIVDLSKNKHNISHHMK